MTAQIAAPLGVAQLLTGSLCKLEQVLRLDLELLDASGFIVATSSFTQPLVGTLTDSEQILSRVESWIGEQVGGLVVTPQWHSEIRPDKTRSGLLGVFHQLSRAGSPGPLKPPFISRLNFLLEELNRVARPGTSIALVSDFLDLDEQGTQALSAIVRHNQVSCYWIHDDTETQEWLPGNYSLLTEQGSVEIDLETDAAREGLHKLQQEHCSRVEEMCTHFRLPLIPVSCNREITPQILQGLGF